MVAIAFIAMLSLFVAAAVMRAQLEPAVRARELAAQGAEKRASWLKVYVYDVDLCQLLKLQNLVLINRTFPNPNMTIIYGRPDLENASAGIYSVSLNSTTKILLLNEGPPIKIEVLAIEAYGSLAKELRPGVELKPGEFMLFSPDDLGLPKSVDLIYYSGLRVVVYTSLQESVEATVIYLPPDPSSVVMVDENGTCVSEVTLAAGQG